MSHKKIILIVALGICVLVGTLAFFFLQPNNHTATVGIGQKEQEEASKQDAAKKEALATNQGSTSSNTKSDSSQLSTYTPPSSNDKVVISASQNKDQVIVIAKLYGYSDGSCTLTVSSNGSSKSYSAPVMFNREYSTCNGFVVPTNTLGTGTWDVVMQVTSGGVTTSKETSIGVQ